MTTTVLGLLEAAVRIAAQFVTHDEVRELTERTLRLECLVNETS